MHSYKIYLSAVDHRSSLIGWVLLVPCFLLSLFLRTTIKPNPSGQWPFGFFFSLSLAFSVRNEKLNKSNGESESLHKTKQPLPLRRKSAGGTAEREGERERERERESTFFIISQSTFLLCIR